MGHVNQRGRDRWEVRVELGRDPLTGKRKRIIRQVNGTKRDAQAKLAEIVRSLETGEYTEPSKLTLSEYLDRWLAHMRGQLAPSAHGRYTAIVELHIKPRLGAVLLQKLQPAHIIDVEAFWLERGRIRPPGRPLSAKTVVNHHIVLHKALHDAVRVFRVLRSNPADSVTPPRWEKRTVARLTLDEALRLIDALEAHPYGWAIYTLLYTGLRAGELIGLRWREDVDLVRRQISVQQQWDQYARRFRDTKSHRATRPVSLDTDVVAVLHRQKVRQAEWHLAAGIVWTDSGLVFTDETGQHLTHGKIAYALETVLKVAGLPRMTPHGLRHAHASLMVASGAPAKVIQERLGHATFAFTMDTYGHLIPGMQDAAAEKFSESLRRQTSRG
jgi:integrase